jgi:hypothetical protein
MFPTDMSWLEKCMVSFHVEGDISRITVENLLRDAQPLHCVYQTIIPFRKCFIVEGCIIEFGLDYHGFNIFTMRPLSGISRCLPIGGFHLRIVNSTRRYP